MESQESTKSAGVGDGTPEAVEEVLARCIERARAAGVAIVWGAFEVYAGEHEPEKVIGCCALGAFDLFRDEATEAEFRAMLGVANGELAAGFDGWCVEDGEVAGPWRAVGARLRERYQPVLASTVGGGA